MKQRGEVIDFSRSEFELCGLGTVPLNEACAIAAELYRRSDELYQAAFSTPGDMGTFNRATDMRLLADDLERHAPELDDKNVARLFDELETLLNDA